MKGFVMIQTSDAFKEKCSLAACRSCGRHGLEPILDLGMMPLSDGLLTPGQLSQPETLYPLEVAFCAGCSLVQILETVPPQVLFGEDYPYYSSFSDALLAHSRANALNLIAKRRLGPDSLVVELASNDGYLLRNFVEQGIPVLGIDPAPGPATAARQVGVPTLCTFFGKELARKLRSEGKRADVMIANNVLAHVADTNGFVQGMSTLLKDSGVIVIEVPYVRDLIDHCEFDTIYHEHLCYFSATSLDRLFRRHKLYLNNVERLSIHGGSLRLFVEKEDCPRESVVELLEEERTAGVDRYEYYQRFAQKVREIRQDLGELLHTLQAQGKRLAAYGAAAKGTILLNYVGAGSDMIRFVVDRNVHKQGKYVPGMRIPIEDPSRLMQDMPDYVLLLPWNFKDEILSQQQPYRSKGGKFIIPIPSPAIV
jgi:SAM-dependent methyltransferase